MPEDFHGHPASHVMTLSFYGAGASAPFGIPTMQAMVPLFEGELERDGTRDERELYRDIRSFLTSALERSVDLEAVFTVVDSIIDWSPERLGVSALYHATKATSDRMAHHPPDGRADLTVARPAESTVKTARTLRGRFEAYIQRACQIPEDQSANIERIYDALFGAFNGLGGIGVNGRKRGYVSLGAMFTTNYDAVLEHFWLDCAEAPLETGFEYDNVARMNLSRPERFNTPGGLRLFKLHGSITWLDDPRYGLTEHQEPPQGMKTYTGRRFTGQVMLYPIEEKTLYTEPYLTMYQMLNRELQRERTWVVVGYSFGDRVIRDIFIRNSRDESRLALVHPRATDIARRLVGIRGEVHPLQRRFGEGDLGEFAQELSRAFLPK